MGTIWVQSKYSKDAKKWEAVAELSDTYKVNLGHSYIHLPKDEYNKCDPPERWEICTRDRVGLSENGMRLSMAGGMPVHVSAGYRWAWSEEDPDALVIERKVP